MAETEIVNLAASAVESDAKTSAETQEDNTTNLNDTRSLHDTLRDSLKSSLHHNLQSWVDPWEPKIEGSFYHKDLNTLRPRYGQLIRQAGRALDDIFRLHSAQNPFDPFPARGSNPSLRSRGMRLGRNESISNSQERAFLSLDEDNFRSELDKVPTHRKSGPLVVMQHDENGMEKPRKDLLSGGKAAGRLETKESIVARHSEGSQGSEDEVDELKRRDDLELEQAEQMVREGKIDSDGSGEKKFGTWDGVVARCLLNIFGVIMFLRLGWMVGQAGVLYSVLIIILCASVTFVTTLSMSAIATNGQITGSGVYFMVSRILGPEFGGTVGILFGVGNAVATSMYLIGFAETFIDIFDENDEMMLQDRLWNIRLMSNLLLVVETILVLLGGMKVLMKLHLVLLLIVCSMILMIFVGGFYNTNSEITGLDGFTNGNLGDNLGPEFDADYNFFTVLAVFFPACTGIMAGANVSSRLRNPSENIPLGTMIAIAVTTASYVVAAVMLGAIVSRTALLDNSLIMKDISVSGVYFIVGVFIASASAGITSLTSAPFILQSVLEDGIVPVMNHVCCMRDKVPESDNNVFDTESEPIVLETKKSQKSSQETKQGKQVAKHRDENPNNRSESVRGGVRRLCSRRWISVETQMLFVCFIICFGCNMVGSLNSIAPLITDFYLIAYMLLNLSCFQSSIAHSPNWRPLFKYYNKYLALLGSVECLFFMIVADIYYALASLLLVFVLYWYIKFADPAVHWGQVQESRQYYDVLKQLMKLRYRVTAGQGIYHRKHWRPGFLVLQGDALHRAQLVYFASTLSKSYGPRFFANIRVRGNKDDTSDRYERDSAQRRRQMRLARKDKYCYYLPTDKLYGKLAEFEEMHRRRRKSQASAPICADGTDGTDGSGAKKNGKKTDAEDQMRRDEMMPLSRDESARDVVFADASELKRRYAMKPKGFYDTIYASNFRDGAQILLQTVGLGALRPNTLILGFRHNWRHEGCQISNKSAEYLDIIRDTLETGYALMILRNFELINWSSDRFETVPKTLFSTSSSSISPGAGNKAVAAKKKDDVVDIAAISGVGTGAASVAKTGDVALEMVENKGRKDAETAPDGCDHVPSQGSEAVDPKDGIIASDTSDTSDAPRVDVWWLLDDGGLTVLVPYIMQLHSFWKHCELRLNIIVGLADGRISEVEAELAASRELLEIRQLIKLFRLPYCEPNAIFLKQSESSPDKCTLERFASLTRDEVDIEQDCMRPRVVLRWLKVAELLRKHSHDAGVVFVTLPLPVRYVKQKFMNMERFGKASKMERDAEMKVLKREMEQKDRLLYFALMEMLSEAMPPTVMIRGNGESVLTYYMD